MFAFCCAFLLIMLSYMYERKSNILQDLRALYQLPYGMVGEIPAEIRKQLWKGELWNYSYYVETIGSVSEENIRRYIEHPSKSY